MVWRAKKESILETLSARVSGIARDEFRRSMGGLGGKKVFAEGKE
jgi:hypothetical protein